MGPQRISVRSARIYEIGRFVFSDGTGDKFSTFFSDSCYFRFIMWTDQLHRFYNRDKRELCGRNQSSGMVCNFRGISHKHNNMINWLGDSRELTNYYCKNVSTFDLSVCMCDYDGAVACVGMHHCWELGMPNMLIKKHKESKNLHKQWAGVSHLQRRLCNLNQLRSIAERGPAIL